ncbi:MAG TPA: DUF2225 domain-containing protein [Hungateiclostridium thermocellum]|jgi:uncharacterized protein (DUF2225 family)|uniref:DUF2225 domain-containing protein n=2 Tax=Acetivibrio thermocellus TaxID=1515 RepID=A3DEB4_ACET2|nr:DUF2225 domain-containing protein [Acetivibrio thermocellus]ABN52293.1 Protein of unknown function DUF2225 [Acetivibrio thermocellus ATCC 27405]ADU74217.1 Protein of unknown function DUF2225 [Acetivibrio thermocellus DSM 1313]ALX08160.1 Protein of unknown function DUF2225 [Acetivibrio thermocellus AD2]ANV75907.1 Protein of unknown function DUF2225 [Acetivibrio thermocellus DSM 2360]EIC05910.1 Protein of unknown function DUF2225 [Acetivibrio thermocellus YS]
MLDSLYNKSVVCPVCQNKIEVTKVKSKDCVVASRDSDFCVYYESVNPLFYEVWVCEHCGYAALQERFENISPIEAKIVKENISKYWKPRSFCGERDVDKAIEAFKLALYNLCKISPKPIEYAKVCLRIAWLYRMKKDEQQEIKFLNHALRYYRETYENEPFPVGKLDEHTCVYMIGELSRRVGNYDDAIFWFNKIISSPGARENKALIDSTREQYHLAKEAKEAKEKA